MKKNLTKIYVFIMFIIIVSSMGYVRAINLKPNKIIYIDPGHGGADPGAVYKDIYESDINLEISLNLKNKLEENGYIVYMTRYDDYDLSVPHAENRKRSDLSRRGNIINRSECDLYMSIHLNAENSSSWYGAQVFYDDVNPLNKEYAQIMQKTMSSNLRTKRKVQITNEMYLHKRVKQPGILLEVGFLSNPNERYLLRQKWYQEKLANVISMGVDKIFK